LIFLLQKVNTSQVSVFHFNPTCEIAIANGSPYYVPPAILCEFESNLAPIMLFFATKNDFVICNQIPGEAFIKQLDLLQCPLPRFITIEGLKEFANDNKQLEISLKSWGKSPAEANSFRFLKAGHVLWDANLKALFERKKSIEFVNRFLRRADLPDIICRDVNQKLVYSEADVESLLASNKPYVIKAPLSSSGRGLLVLRKKTLNEANRQWIRGNLGQLGYLVASIWLNKTYDLSFQFEINSNGKVFYLGLSFFITNSNGQYTGHHLNFKNSQQFPLDPKTLQQIGELLCNELANSDFPIYHRGALGIDALIYVDDEANVKLHPCLEINPRYTMGALSLQIEKRIHPDSHGKFEIYFDAKGGFYEFAEAKQRRNPLAMRRGLIHKGFYSITPSDGSSKFGAYIELL